MPRPTLFDHPKFARLCYDLRMPRPHVLGHLEFLWKVAYASGNARIGDAVDVELAAAWEGEPGALAAALVRNRFLDEAEGVFLIHDLADHAPEYVRDRRRKELERNAKKLRAGPDCPGQVPDKSRTNAGHAPEVPGTPTPTPTPTPTHTHTGGERGDSAPLAPRPEDLLQIWNEERGPLPEARELTKERRAHARRRLEEEPDLTVWRAIVRRIAASPFCRGNGDRSWTASIDFLLQPGTRAKVLEGAYDDRARPRPPQPGAHPPAARRLDDPGAPEWVRAAVAALRAGRPVDQPILDRLEAYRTGAAA